MPCYPLDSTRDQCASSSSTKGTSKTNTEPLIDLTIGELEVEGTGYKPRITVVFMFQHHPETSRENPFTRQVSPKIGQAFAPTETNICFLPRPHGGPPK